MSTIPPVQTSSLPPIPTPESPTERLLYLGVIMGVAALIVLGLGATWCVMTVNGNGAEFPVSLQNAFYAGLAFLFGGGIAAKI